MYLCVCVCGGGGGVWCELFSRHLSLPNDLLEVQLCHPAVARVLQCFRISSCHVFNLQENN